MSCYPVILFCTIADYSNHESLEMRCSKHTSQSQGSGRMKRIRSQAGCSSESGGRTDEMIHMIKSIGGNKQGMAVTV